MHHELLCTIISKSFIVSAFALPVIFCLELNITLLLAVEKSTIAPLTNAGSSL